MKIDVKKLQKLIAIKQETSASVAARAGISAQAFSAIMQQKSNPRPRTIGRIAAALNCEIEDITE